MNDILIYLEDIIVKGYSILLELEQDQPNINRVDVLYKERGKLMEMAHIKWEELRTDNAGFEPSPTEIERIQNLFIRINLLEKNLNKHLEKIRLQKLSLLQQLNQMRDARAGYTVYNMKDALSMLVDIRSHAY